MTEPEAIEVLVRVRKSAGHYWRRLVHECWHNGEYRRNCLDKFEGSLQRIRNTFGPSWLSRVSLPTRGDRFEVVVGNLGCVHRSSNRSRATSQFVNYTRMSRHNYGRAAGEEVSLFEDGELRRHHTPPRHEDAI